jgi:hypothetical protein
MTGTGKKNFSRGAFHDAAHVNDRNFCGHPLDNGKVVTDHKKCDFLFLIEVDKKIGNPML